MKKELEKILKKYISKFEKKHELTFEFAVSNDLMGTISFSCIYYFSINDIIFDIDNYLPKDLIIHFSRE